MPYFCVPQNDKILGLWDTVADRLFKIRHCMNIEGVVRQLPLFEPPIDPALLVKAKAAGLDIGGVLADLHAPPPLHRFPVIYQRALDFAGFVAGLGGQLLVGERFDVGVCHGYDSFSVGCWRTWVRPPCWTTSTCWTLVALAPPGSPMVAATAAFTTDVPSALTRRMAFSIFTPVPRSPG
jgi:hypothetical protein